MIVINTVSAKRFSLNGIEYFKNYISEVAGNQLTIFNAYDRKDVKVEWSAFGNFLVDNIAFSNVADLQSALLDVIYTRGTLGGILKTPVNLKVTYNSGTGATVPAGFTLTRITSLNDTNSDFTGIVTGTNLVITSGVNGDVYLIDGYITT